jgi:lysozyme
VYNQTLYVKLRSAMLRNELSMKRSDLVKKLNAKDYKGAAEQFLVWNKGRVNGVLQVIPGLTNRRIKEKAYFEK